MAKTIQRADFGATKPALEEIEQKLAAGMIPDYITLAGSGEPTLHTGLGDFVQKVKSRWGAPVAVITNGSLLWEPSVQHEVAQADLVMPSLDAGSEAAFQRVNRPHPSLELERIVDGMAAFRDSFSGIIWLEILLVQGVTDTDDEVMLLAEHAARIRPDRIHVTTPTRPSQTEAVQAVPIERLRAIAQVLGEKAEVVSPGPHTPMGTGHATPDDVLDLVRRHPCSMDDIAYGLGISTEECAKHIVTLQEQGRIVSTIVDGLVMYVEEVASTMR